MNLPRTLPAFALVILLSGAASAQDPAPPAPPPPDPRVVLDEVARYGDAHPEDVVGLRDRYLAARAQFERDSEGFRLATERIEALAGEIDEAYLLLRPTSGRRRPLDERETRKVAIALKRDLRSRHALVRLRAIEYLGLLGSGTAVPALVKVLTTEEETETIRAAATALKAIGGEDAAAGIERLLPGAQAENRKEGISVLTELIRDEDEKVFRRASLALGRLVFLTDDETVELALTVLERAGGPGVWGLMRAASIKDHQLKLRVLGDLGNTGEGRGAVALGMFLDIGAKGRDAEYKEVACASIRKLGIEAVPWLVRFLEDPNCRQWTKRCLYDITGQSFERAEEVKVWLGKHRPEKEGEDGGR